MIISSSGKFVALGWGKKETQFHGSEGKQAAHRKQTVLYYFFYVRPVLSLGKHVKRVSVIPVVPVCHHLFTSCLHRLLLFISVI